MCKGRVESPFFFFPGVKSGATGEQKRSLSETFNERALNVANKAEQGVNEVTQFYEDRRRWD